jgi:hypothetical protein
MLLQMQNCVRHVQIGVHLETCIFPLHNMLVEFKNLNSEFDDSIMMHENVNLVQLHDVRF